MESGGGFDYMRKAASGTRCRPTTMLKHTSTLISMSPAFDKRKKITLNPMARTDVLRMVKRRASAAGLPYSTCCHTFRATGITAYLENGGTIENAQAIAAHESPRTTKLYDRTSDDITLDEIERILIWPACGKRLNATGGQYTSDG